jgi:endonuclease/exonuclease/phosphatase family metal-dependent hydrolase
MTNEKQGPLSSSSPLAGSSADRGATEAPKPLRLMTYNVRYFAHGTRGIVTTGGAFTRIARALAALSPTPDIICLQEVETQSIRASTMNPRWHPEETQLERILAELHTALAAAGKPERYIAHYFPAHDYRLTRRTSIYTTGLAILARADLKVIHHNVERPHDITFRRMNKNLKQTRICAHLAFEHGGEVFDVFNTHLSLPGFLYKQFWAGHARMGFGPNQLEEARVLADFVERERRGKRFVIVGDFNTLPGSTVDTYLREERGLVDTLAHHHQWDVRQARAFATAGFLRLRMHLDHIYASDGLRTLDFDDTHAFGVKGTFAGLSDHVPLITRIG